MDRLIKGYRRFRSDHWPQERRRFEELSAGGQRPRAMVIACSDSRVDPQMIFDAGPGELFVVRNVANLVPPYAPDSTYHGTSAALEFAVRVLQIQHLVVLGHALCGGVQALLQGSAAADHDFIHNWVSIGNDARARVESGLDDSERQQACEHEIIRLSLNNLLTFPWIRSAVEAGTLELHGCYFDMRSGLLLCLNDDGSFAPVSDLKTGPAEGG
jgi:carbonic anhydrase